MSGSANESVESGLRTSIAKKIEPFRWDFLRKPRQPFIGLVIFAALGIFCADRWPQSVASVFAVAGIIALLQLCFRATWLVLPFVACVFFGLHTLNLHGNAGRELARDFSLEPAGLRAVGIVDDEPVQKTASNGFLHAHFYLRLESVAMDDNPLRPSNARMLVKWQGAAPHYGDRVEINAPARLVPPPRNPGQFDYAAYLHRLGIYCEIDMRHPEDGRVIASDCGNPLFAFAFKARRWMQRQLVIDLEDDPEIAGVIQGMVLGLKSETPPEIMEMFQRTGTLHLFVVNGLHVGMLATIVWFIVWPMQLGRVRGVLVVVPLLMFYTLVTGLNSGSIRATIMAAVFLGARFVDRAPLPLNSLFAAAFGLLLWDTNEMFMTAWQFSFGVVFSILLFAGFFQRKLIPIGQPDPFLPRRLWGLFQRVRFFCWRHVVQLIGVSVAAWLGSLPFTACYFHLVSLLAVVANLFIVPCAFVILAQGVLAMLFGIFSSGLAAILNNSNWAVAKFVLWLVGIFAHIPGGHVYVEMPRLREPLCEINVFDLGDGGAVHLRSDGRDWMFDSGGAFDYETTVRSYLRTRGVNRLDGLLLSHGDSAHIGGALPMLKDFSPLQIVDSPLTDRSKNRRAFHAGLAARGLGKGIYLRGDWLQISPATRARVLYPPGGIFARVADDKALVLQVEFGGSRVLFVFDSGFFTEQWLMENERDLHSDILVRGRHASDISGTLDFIEAVAPRVIVTTGKVRDQPLRFTVEAAKFSETWAEQVVARGIALFRQDETGAVQIEITRDGFEVRGFVNGQTFRSRAR